MSRFIGYLLCVVLFAGAAPVPGAQSGTPTILVFGDSISAGYGIAVDQGWVNLLSAKLQKEGYGFRVVNASVSGETTGGGLARLPRVLSAHRPAILLVELGANDGLRGLPVEQIKKNLTTIVQVSKREGVRVVLVGMQLPPNYGPEYTSKFAAAFGAVASAFHTALVPFLLERVALDDANFQADRLHPIAAVEGKVLDTVWAVLKPLLHKAPAVAPAATH